MFGKRKPPESAANHAPLEELEVDPETRLMGAARFEECIEKEIARGMRYGSGSALALFEVAVAEDTTSGPLPSPARFVAQVLVKAARTSDMVARLSSSASRSHGEAHTAGASQFTERCSHASVAAYARRPGYGVYVARGPELRPGSRRSNRSGLRVAASER